MAIRIASRKNAIPSIAKGSPKTSPYLPVSPGHSSPISKESTVPEAAPTAKVRPAACDQRRARVSATESLWRNPL